MTPVNQVNHRASRSKHMSSLSLPLNFPYGFCEVGEVEGETRPRSGVSIFEKQKVQMTNRRLVFGVRPSLPSCFLQGRERGHFESAPTKTQEEPMNSASIKSFISCVLS